MRLLCIGTEMNKNVKGKQRSFHHPWKNERKTISALLSATTKRFSKLYLYATYKTEWLTFTHKQELPSLTLKDKANPNSSF